jgi:hypothetical protein
VKNMKKVILIILILTILSSVVQAFPQYSNELVKDLVAYWNMNEGSGTLVADSVGANAGTANASCAWLGSGLGITPQGGGANSGNALVFNGASRVVIGDVLQITGALTYSVWFKTDQVPANPDFSFIMGRYNGDGVANVASHLFVSGDVGNVGKISLLVYKFGGSVDIVRSDIAYNDGIWHMATCVYVPSTSISIYIDGAIKGMNTTNIESEINSSVIPFTLGMQGNVAEGWRPYSGSLDNAMVWDRALSDDEILLLYKQAKNAKAIESLTNLLILGKVPYGFAWRNE